MRENIVVLKKENGELVSEPNIDGLVIDFKGAGARIEIAEGSVFKNSKMIVSSNCSVSIGKTHARGIINTTVDMGGVGRNKQLHLGAGISIEGCRFAMANESFLDIELGDNCLLSSNITFRSTDGHTIFDVGSGKVVNMTRKIVVGDHVWIGANATILKGAIISANSIVGTHAVVAGVFGTENVVIAGNPARVVKENVGWDRKYIDSFRDSDYTFVS